MYSLVLIDDEQIVRKNIIKKIDWETYGFKIVGEAENGREGLEVIDSTVPDVVITDIEMPFMNGLELSAATREKYPTTKIVLLTGYDEFKYAQQAIELNVIEYILKPVSSENLIKVLEKIKGKLDEEISNRKNIDALREHFEKSTPVMKSNFYNSLLCGNMDREEITEKAEYFKMDFNGDLFIASVLSMDKSSLEHKDISRKDKELYKFAMLNTAKEIAFKYNINDVFINEDNVVVINCFKGAEKGRFLSETYRVLDEIRQVIAKYLSYTVTIGIGTICSSIVDINESYKNAMNALEYKLIIGSNRLIFIEDMEPKEQNGILIDENKEHRFLSCIKVGAEEELDNILEDLFSVFKNKKGSYVNYQLYLLEIVALIAKAASYASTDKQPVFNFVDNNIFDTIFKFESLDEVKAWVREICLKLMGSISSKRVNSCKYLVEKAKDYIKNSYNDSELSLNNVSSFLHISPSYFGSIFKNETGDTFVNYLLKVRMEKAKDMICTTDMKNFEIAEKVGYSDQHYFSYSFKKYYKSSPNEFRNSLTSSHKEKPLFM